MLKNLIFTLFLASSSAQAQEIDENNEAEAGSQTFESSERFDITQLPKGAEVVLPHPATTLVPLHLKVQVTPTDKKQLLKIGSFSEGSASSSFQLAIYDKNLSRVKYLTIRPGSFVVYHFKNLGRIQLVPKVSKTPLHRNTKLLLESNRPLGLSY